MTHFCPSGLCNWGFQTIAEGIVMSKQAEFAVILKMNPMFADLGADELQRLSNL